MTRRDGGFFVCEMPPIRPNPPCNLDLQRGVKFLRPLWPVLLAMVSTASPSQADPSKYQQWADAARNQHVSGVVEHFSRLAGPDGILDTGDVAEIRASELADYRSRLLEVILRNDVNGDGTVTTDEIRRMDADKRDQVENYVQSYLRADANGDGSITLDEALELTREYASRVTLFPAPQSREAAYWLEWLDTDSDGKVSEAEATKAIEATYFRLDTDGNGFLKHADIARLRPDWSALNCTLPKPKPATKVIVLDASERKLISNVTISGQAETTRYAEFEVQPGHEPIYLIGLSSSPTIWKLTGATDRVQRFIIFGNRTRWASIAAGVVGLTRDRITFADFGCLNDRVSPGLSKLLEMRIADLVKWQAGNADVATGYGSIESLRSARPSARQYWDVPTGISNIDPSDVVSDARAERYDLLPGAAGLNQLLESGHLKRIDWTTYRGASTYSDVRGQERPLARETDPVFYLGKTVKHIGGETYLVVKPISNLPADFPSYGSMSLVFAEGVPLSPKIPYGITVAQEKDGRLTQVDTLRRSFYDPLDFVSVEKPVPGRF